MTSPSQEALDALIDQFHERTAFIRELIQNSLDANTGRVEIIISWHNEQELIVEVVDDGEGMNLEIIEKHLLTLFSSSKEQDLTKIGKFGVGFVSVFALRPDSVEVVTGRDGEQYKVVFDAKRDYRIYSLEEPLEGTTVRIIISCQEPQAKELAIDLRKAIHYWCRYAHAEIWIECLAAKWGWQAEEVVHPFTIENAVVYEERTDGFHAVLGFVPDEKPMVGYYNRGLTLLEETSNVIPGVSFRVKADSLEHTLTRDNVARDRHYQLIMDRLQGLASGKLRDRTLEQLKHAIEVADWPLQRQIIRLAGIEALAFPTSLPCFRAVSGELYSLQEIRSTSHQHQFLWAAENDDFLAQKVTAEGQLVLHQADAQILASILQRKVAPIHQFWACIKAVECPAFYDTETVKKLDLRPLTWANFRAAGNWVEGQEWVRVPYVGRAFLTRNPANISTVAQGQFFSARGEKLKATETVWNTKGPLITKIAALPPDIGGLVFARVVELYCDGIHGLNPRILALAREL